MPKTKSDNLFKLIKSLKKSEKRYFKLNTLGESSGDNKKFIKLFDEIDQQEHFDEDAILANSPEIKPEQLSNIKAHLYKRILQSLRGYHSSKVPEIEIREIIDFAEILYNRCLYAQCVKVLQKAKKKAKKYDYLELLLEIYKLEKQVLIHTVGKDNQERVNNIVSEVQEVNDRINNINTFTNLAAQLNTFYLKAGFIRDQKDYFKIRKYIKSCLPAYDENVLSLNEKLHLYELLVGYYFFIQDFNEGYNYAKKWVDLFIDSKEIIASRLDMYIKGINNLMIAQYKLLKYHEFVDTHRKLKEIRNLNYIELNENIQVKLFKYNYVHEFNRYFMLGDFEIGVAHFNKIKNNIESYITRLDRHSRIIMYYKIACLYFGNDNHREAIAWINRIINEEDVDLREDIHCFARILNLICHYEVGNNDVIEYYIRSTYRFLLKKDDLHNFQKYILNFLKKLNRISSEEQLINQFEGLLKQLLPLTQNRYEKRAFIYFDIISWLECKIRQEPIREVVKEKARQMIERETQLA